MTKYMVLIYGDAAQWTAMSPAEQRAHEAGHVAFRAAAGAAVLTGEELEPSPSAATVRADRGDGRPGRVVVTDGPFGETKEALGGFYMLEAATVDEVVALVRHLPEVSAGHSGVEIRRVVDHG